MILRGFVQIVCMNQFKAADYISFFLLIKSKPISFKTASVFAFFFNSGINLQNQNKTA